MQNTRGKCKKLLADSMACIYVQIKHHPRIVHTE